MSIFRFFNYLDLTGDQRFALDKIEKFIHSDKQIFILKGYAGTGKTTLIRGLVKYLESINLSVEVMAPTGRAAKILKDKVGRGSTIHSSIYNLKELKREEKKDDEYKFHYYFPIKKLPFYEGCFIVDEASMISSVKSKNELFTFGTDILLNDLLTYSKLPDSKIKIIFIGDPAQLPPVGDRESKALSKEYFEGLGLQCEQVILKQVVRQEKNLILSNAFKLREALESNRVSELVLDYDDSTFVSCEASEIPQLYFEHFPVPTLDNGVVIALSNTQCLNYNKAIRKQYFNGNKALYPGDILLVTHNHYHIEPPLLNGDFIQVTEVQDRIIERKNIPVYVPIKGKKEKIHITLKFKKIRYRTKYSESESEAFIIFSMLDSIHRDLSIAEFKALFVDFVLRFKDEQKRRKERGQESYNIYSEQFQNQLESDPFFNALRVKYGYAVTCHKAQGGEWDTVFIDFWGRNSIKPEPLRWAYTAVTRAKNKCFVANAPYVTSFYKLQFSDIVRIKKIPDEAFDFSNIPVSPYHNEHSHPAKSLKYWEVSEKLQDTSFQIINVQSLGEFQERYSIALGEEIDFFDAYHNKAGIFKPFKAVRPGRFSWQEEVLKILNKPYRIFYNIDYIPSNETFRKLYQVMQSLCEPLDIQITNVVEYLDRYFVNYYFQIDRAYAYIQFYFNKEYRLTRAMPRITEDNEKFNKLIEHLKRYFSK